MLLSCLLESLKDVGDQFHDFKSTAEALCNSSLYQKTEIQHCRKKKRLFYDNCDDEVLNPTEKLKVEVYLPVIDNLLVALKESLTVYTVINERVSLLTNVLELSFEILREKSLNLLEVVRDNLENTFPAKTAHFVDMIKSLEK